MFEAILITAVISLLTAYIQHRQTPPEKIFGVYSQPGKWYYLKFISVYILIWARRLAKLMKPTSVVELEEMKCLSEHEKAFDATFVQAVSNEGIYFCGGIEKRHGAKVNALFYIVLPELGLLEGLEMPNTLLDADPVAVLLKDRYGGGGISFQMVDPMRKWKVSFNEKMRVQNDPSKIVEVKLNGEWTSKRPYFLFEEDVTPKCLADAIARETWSDEYFKTLKSAHQTHYEQMGYFNGTLSIGNKLYILNMDAFRDHSYGYKRDWTLMHRYIFHMMYLENGTRISLGVVSQPCTTSLLLMGYVLQGNNLHTIESCDLLLYQHGETGNPGTDYAFSFSTSEDTYEAKVAVKYESVHFKGTNVEAKLIERFIECEVNGVKGRGISEWHYNNQKTK